VPLSGFGYQAAADGNAYAGVATFSFNSPYYRELLATQLSSPLQVGVPTHLSFKASPGGFGYWHANSARWVSKNIGMKFFVTLPPNWQWYLYPNSDALHLDQELSDTSSWVTVSGTYVPDSAYTHLVIANFFEDSLSAPLLLFPSGGADAAYAFIDEVCVSQNGPCGSTDVNDLEGLEGMAVLNPFAEMLRIRFALPPTGPLALRLYNMDGAIVWSRTIETATASITEPINILPDGIYVLQALDSRGHQHTLRLVHVQP
jgi:hypothetical protein